MPDFTRKYLSIWQLLGIMTACFVIIVARRQGIVFNAEPWAEDGAVWMQDAYNQGFWNSVFLPWNGYLQTSSRITCGFALLFGLSYAPLVTNVVAILIRCCFVGFLLSKRMSFLELKYRFAIVAYFLLMPNLAEGYVNITNAHWYLAMYFLAVVLAKDPDTPLWKIHDYILIAISGLSGVFCLFIAPCLIIKRLYTRQGFMNAIKGINAFDIVVALCCIIQLTVIIYTWGGRGAGKPLGASYAFLADIIAYRVIFGSFTTLFSAHKMAGNEYVNIALFTMLWVSLAYAFIKANWQVKSLILFPVLSLAASLISPVIPSDPSWQFLFDGMAGAGERYFFITNVAYVTLWVLLIASLKGKVRKICFTLGMIFMAYCAFGHHRFFIYEMPACGYYEDIAKFEQAASGETVVIRIQPDVWRMTLVKK